jgi:AcrR family transcriptional regulator
MSIQKTQRSDGNETRARIKAVAQRLFALHGLHGVAVKDIVEAAEQRNKASVQYHFGSKEALIGELLVDGAKEADAYRQEMLREMAAAGGPHNVRDVLQAFIWPVERLTESEEGSTYLRFLANVQMTHRQLIKTHIGNRWNAGYRQCLHHFRSFLTRIPPALLEQRLSLVGDYATTIFASKEAARDEGRASNRFWSAPYTVDNIIDTFQAMLECEPSPSTLALLDEGARG